MFPAAMILVLPATLLQGPGRLGAERPRPGPRAEARRELRRDRLLARIHRLRMSRIQQSLGVPEDKARSIADRWASFDQDSAGRRQEAKGLREQVKGILVGPGSEEDKNARLRPLLERMGALGRQQQEARHAFEEDVRSGLTPAQQGRFILLVPEFDRSIREAMAQEKRP